MDSMELLRAKHLLSAAYALITDAPIISGHYMKLMRALCVKSGVALPDKLHPRFCAYCSTPLVAGENCRTRIVRRQRRMTRVRWRFRESKAKRKEMRSVNMVTFCCLSCGWINVFSGTQRGHVTTKVHEEGSRAIVSQSPQTQTPTAKPVPKKDGSLTESHGRRRRRISLRQALEEEEQRKKEASRSATSGVLTSSLHEFLSVLQRKE